MADAQDARVPGGPPERLVRRGLGIGGSIGAVVLFWLSLTPSLLPRHWVLQGVLSGVAAAIGYAAGAMIGATARTAWRTFWPAWRPRPPAWLWRVLAGTGGAVTVVFLVLGHAWQRELRQLVGIGPPPVWGSALLVVVASGVFAFVLAAARTVRLGTRRLAAAFARFSPRPVASIAAVGAVAALTYGVGQSVVLAGLVDVADRVAEAASGTIAPGATPPASPYVSGGPGSLVAWDSLGAYGRKFTAGAVTRRELVEFGVDDPVSPIRIYVGRDSAETAPEQAELAVQELVRTGGFDRTVVAVIITTGTGWVNPAVPAALEYLHGGDTAVVATQYSYLPSLISFLADRGSTTDAAAALIAGVQEHLETLPADQRPALVLYGESLGAYGIERAFDGLDDLVAGIDAALLVGPPHTSPIWQQVTAERDEGSPVWLPTYRGGGTVRFAPGNGDLPAGPGRPQVVYLQNASDPVVWWSPELLYRPPEWLDERSPALTGAMRWLPVVTFCQVTIDGTTSSMAPPGHGHRYHEGIAGAWAELVPAPGWSDADTTRLRALLRYEYDNS